MPEVLFRRIPKKVRVPFVNRLVEPQVSNKRSVGLESLARVSEVFGPQRDDTGGDEHDGDGDPEREDRPPEADEQEPAEAQVPLRPKSRPSVSDAM